MHHLRGPVGAALLGATLLSAAFLGPSPAHEQQSAKESQPQAKGPPLVLKFGVYTSSKATTMYREFSPILGYLQQSLEEQLSRSVDIELKIYKSYDEGIQAIVSGAVDFSRIGPASYCEAKEKNPALQLLVMEANEGTNRFKGILFARADSSIREVRDLKGKKFAFGDQHSTIGRYLTQAELAKAGVHAKDLADYKYLGRHDTVLKAVEIGDFDAGAVKPSAFKKASDKDQLRVIKTYDNVTQPWVARAGLEAQVCDALRQSMLGIKDQQVLGPLDVSGFLPTSDEEYRLVRDGMKLSREFEGSARPDSPKASPGR
jgi:phosphonate transport system substrate-binding protein